MDALCLYNLMETLERVRSNLKVLMFIIHVNFQILPNTLSCLHRVCIFYFLNSESALSTPMTAIYWNSFSPFMTSLPGKNSVLLLCFNFYYN